ncbi:MAG: tRNA pseudouridine(55) synthase TruB [Actinobacteria bacterium]|nr:MAG: tRNA pseudouridine(55) synthase TruB [Actinomycetota bacterium]
MGRRGATGLAGVLPVDKPGGMTSHDVVARVRRLTGEGRVGHAGTLDPMATGLLVVLVGPYTRLEPYLSSAEKTYEARIAFGSATDTDDAEGTIVATGVVRPELLQPTFAEETLSRILGPSMQRPPAFSAIKVGGEVAHRAARAGAPLELAGRAIEVFSAELTGIDAENPAWDVRFRVSKGTYIRAIARDLGELVGVPAHLGALRRTASGSLHIRDAMSLEGATDIASRFVDPVAALGLAAIEVDPSLIANGAPLSRVTAAALPDGTDVALVSDGALLGVYRTTSQRLIPRVVLPTGSLR